jgi:predicted acyltransferase
MKKIDINDVQNRLLSLDALRGLAILLMVLSGSIAFGNVLPAWMYHTQVPPPMHIFNPNIAGITWVDLVFPFFLFSMGAAFPLALSKKLKNSGKLLTLAQTLKRYVLLIFFAVFTFHSRAWVMSSTAGTTENLLSMGCFLLLFLMFSKTSFERSGFSMGRQILGFVLAIAFLWLYPFKDGGFSIFKSDIIIVVLANMALFGSVIWIFTQHKPWLRVAVLPMVMAIFLSGKLTDSWVSQVYNWSPLPWAYTFYYLKYLFIIIPGTFAGDWLLRARNSSVLIKSSSITFAIALICLLLVVLNTSFLFSRQLITNVIVTICLAVVVVFLCKKSGLNEVYQNFAYLGVFLLILGLFFEPYEGGIKKDFSTYSYYFVCSGMAFLTIFSFILLEAAGYLKTGFKFMAKVGQNPMIAYTAGNLFLLPFLRIFNLETTLNLLNQTAWEGFARGLIFTSIVALIALFFTNKRIFWKT